jgi:glycosyltransferase involved in cell wall biosynthesis
MKKLLFVIPTLAEGGAEKVMTILLNHLKDEKASLTLVLFNKTGIYLDKIPTTVKVIDLKKKNAYSFPRLVAQLASIIRTERADVVISFLEYANLVTLLARFIVCDSHIRWIISERSLPSRDLAGQRKRKLKYYLHRFLDKRADNIITMSPQTREEMIQDYCVSPEKVEVIPNPVEIEKLRELAQTPPCHPWFQETVPVLVAMGRLTQAKGYPILINAFSRVVARTPARLMILGQGEMKAELDEQVQRLGLKEHVWMPGFIANPYPYLNQATLFILASLWEGLPNALLEAMALGKPVIATSCNDSVNQLIHSGQNGILIPPEDVRALEESILTLLADTQQQDQFAKENIRQIKSYDVNLIIQQFERAFNL